MFFKFGMLRIHPKCKNLISELKTLQFGDTVGDDTTDALRYLCTRVNDLVYGMNIYDKENRAVTKTERGVLSFDNPCLFPGRAERVDRNWVMEEIEAVA